MKIADYLPGFPEYNKIKSNTSNLEGAETFMQFFMNVMPSPTEVGADRIVDRCHAGLA